MSGWDCRAAGAPCQRACLTADESSRAYVTFTVGGKTLDSRAVPYQPAADLTHVLMYGCTLWNIGDAAHQGLDFEYKQLLGGAFAADRRSDFADYVDVSIGSFRGPGSYRASPTYIAGDAAQAVGQVYSRVDGCAVEVAADEEGGVKGTIACDPLAAADGTTVTLSGEFLCPATSLEPIYSRLP